MSVVVTIKRVGGKPPLTTEDVRRVVEQDSSLSGGEREPITWKDPASGKTRYINTVDPATGELETDDMRGDEDSISRFLDKLRSIAMALDARVFGEGDDITEASPPPRPRAGCASVITCAVALLALAAVVIACFT
jgi:hypothetical protein